MISKIEHYSIENPATVYDEEALTALELAARTAATANECVEAVNNMPNIIDEQVRGYMSEGLFDKAIDDYAKDVAAAIKTNTQETAESLSMTRLEVDENKLAMQSQLGNKVDKDGAGQVTLAMLAQDAKQAMTGGSVAVVGTDAVGTNNILDKAVTGNKLAPNVRRVHSYIAGGYDTPFLEINSADMSVKLVRTDQIRFITETTSKNYASTANLTIDKSKWTNGTMVMLWWEMETDTIHVTNALNYYYDYYLLGYFYTGTQNWTCFPVRWNGALYTHNGMTNRANSSLILRQYYNFGTKRVPTISFKRKCLRFPRYCLAYGMNGAYVKQLVNTADGEVEIPFAEGSTLMYLVGTDKEMLFVDSGVYNGGGTFYKYMYCFGFIDTVNETFTLNFECKRERTLSVLGDSISTFNGFNPPQNPVYYNGVGGGIDHVNMTWWARVMNRCGLTLNVNNAYSGARVSGDEDGNGIDRATQLDNGTAPDIIIAYLGINDFNGGVPIGEYDGRSVPTNRNTFKSAYAMMLRNMLKKYPASKVYAMTLPACQKTTNEIDLPELNASGVGLWEYNAAIREVCELFHVEVIEAASCQINNYNGAENAVDFTNSTGAFLHPNKDGFKKIADKVVPYILHGDE